MSTADCISFSSQIKNGLVFLGSADIAECYGFCAKRDSQPNIIGKVTLSDEQDSESNFAFLPRVHRAHQENQVYEETEVLQEKAKWDHWYEHQ